MNIILIGLPGSGKGTQAAKITTLYSMQHLATGDMLRSEIAAASELGLKAKSIMECGDLISDDIVIAMIASRIDEFGALFDGFPRTIAQAQALDELLAKNNQQIDHVIELKVDNEEIVKRMLLRGRDDDNEPTIRNRLAVYNEQTFPLIEYYRKQHKLHSIEGIGNVAEVTKRIVAIIDK